MTSAEYLDIGFVLITVRVRKRRYGMEGILKGKGWLS
jgi:hypothetical protein